MDNHIFRSAALGFNRQDVMEYIEKVQREAEARINGLTAQLDEARQEGEAARQSLEDCTQERDRLSQELAERKEQFETELADLQERYEAEIDARDAAESESDQQKERLRDLEAENSLLTEQVNGLESRMEALRHEKERLTQLELDAHHRSDELLAQTQAQADEILAQARARRTEIETQAQAQAEALLAQTRKQIGASMEKSGELLHSCETIAAHVSGELRKMDVAVAQLPVGMDHLKRRLAELMEPVQENSLKKEPAAK